MTANAESTLRDSLNTSDPNRLPSATQSIFLGEAMNALLAAAAFTEVGIAVVANVATLAATPKALFNIKATAGASTGIKKLLQGVITGAQAIVPAAGQAVWDGGTKVLFNAADAVTAASFLYSTDADPTVSLLQRDIGEQDS